MARLAVGLALFYFLFFFRHLVARLAVGLALFIFIFLVVHSPFPVTLAHKAALILVHLE